jgi:hypothetical protein
MKKLLKRIKKIKIRRKDFWITTLSAVAIGVMLFAGGSAGSSQPTAKSKFQRVSNKKPGKYSVENSEKAHYFAKRRA